MRAYITVSSSMLGMRFVVESLWNGVVLLFVMLMVMGAIHKVCEFHELYQRTSAKLER